MNFIVQNKLEILKYKTLNGAPTDLTNDILAVLARGENEVKVKENEADFEEFSTMCVSELRGRAHAKGLDVDGSREALISTLENASNVERNEGNVWVWSFFYDNGGGAT